MSFDAFTLEQKVGQLFFIGVSGPELDDATRGFLDEVSPGGICLFARNIRAAPQTRALLDDLREHLLVTPFLSVDQEGGLVDRLRRITGPMPAAAKLRTTDDAAKLAVIIGEALAVLGFNMDFAPVVDVIDEKRALYQNGLLSRAFGDNKEDVTALAGAFLDALRSQHIIGCLKHFPGLGGSKVDSHEELPVVDIPEDELSHTDLFPYRRLFTGTSVESVMVAHAAFPQHRLQEWDQNGKLLPSSLSKNFITTLLRSELGFDGLVITDDLEMGAIVKNYGIGDACKMAIRAGADMLAICADPNAVRQGFNAVLEAVKSEEIPASRLDESLRRIVLLKDRLMTPPEFNESRLGELSEQIVSLNRSVS